MTNIKMQQYCYKITDESPQEVHSMAKEHGEKVDRLYGYETCSVTEG